MSEEQKKKTLGIAVASLVFGCFFLIPILGAVFGLTAVILGIVALVQISNSKETLKGNGLAIAGMILGALGLIIVPILSMLAAIAIPNFLRARINAYDSAALSQVKTEVVALESYKAANGKYPLGEYSLISAKPPFIAKPINGRIISGYKYSLELNSDSYLITAEPENCGTTGTKIYKARNTSNIQEESCNSSGGFKRGESRVY